MHPRSLPLPPKTKTQQTLTGWPIGCHPVRKGSLTMALVLCLGACSPTYNWRELRPEGTPLQALMPCKPEVAQRTVPLGEPSTELHMHSCEAGGYTFALSWADVGDPVRTPEALNQLRRAALAAIRVEPDKANDPSLKWEARIPGADRAMGLQASGMQHQQRIVRMRAVLFARGSQVFQAAVYGPPGSDETSTVFFEGLSFP